MSYIKRFANFCGGFSIFSAIMYLVIGFFTYKGEEEASRLDNLKAFLNPDVNKKNMRAYLVLIGLLLIVILASHIFKKLPAVYISMSVLPLAYVTHMFSLKELYERPMLYFILISLQITAYMADVISSDRQSGKKWGAITKTTSCLTVAMLSIFFFFRYKSLSSVELEGLSPKELTAKLPALALQTEDTLPVLFIVIAEIYIIIFFVNILLRDIHFVGTALSIVPLVMLIIFWSMGLLRLYAGALVLAAAVVFLQNLAVTVSAPSASKNQI